MLSKKPVYIVQHNHFDPIWHRCWDRSFDYKGKRYRSYAELERIIFDIWIESAKRGATFSEGQAVIIRKYLESKPEMLPVMRDLVKRGLMEITGAGETVSDTNMPSGETLLRNLVLGQRWFEDTFGVIPSVGWVEDAFGLSAQIPQIFRGCEIEHIIKVCYKPVPTYWRGLDGSVVFAADAPAYVYAWSCYKIPPCPECNGMGCPTCDDMGFASTGRVTDEEINRVLSHNFDSDPFSMVTIGGEEVIPNPNLPELVAEAKAKPDAPDLRWGTWADLAREYADRIGKVDEPGVVTSDQIEANPVSTGCYVSRIEIKKAFRRAENHVIATEKWATIAYLMGAGYPTDCLNNAWRNLVFCAFHDAITCTYLDQPYFELLDMLAEAEHEAAHILDDSFDAIETNMASDPEKDYLVVYNSESWERDDPVSVTLSGTRGVPAIRDTSGNELDVLDISAEGEDVTLTFRPPKVPALGYAAIEVTADSKPIHNGEITSGPGEIENEFFKIRVSDKGIESIFDKRINRETVDASKYLANELILEEDTGHPWGTTKLPEFEEGLSKYTTAVKIRKAEKSSEIILTGQYKGKDENTRMLSWRQSTRIYAGVDRIDFHTEVDWDTAQRRIRIAFPTGIKTSEAMYAIPYGALSRNEYEGNFLDGPSTNGDWPAVNWVDIYDKKDDWGVALINTGTPSHKVLDGVIFMSLLRSPIDSWVLNEPHYYDCPDFDGARDAGLHEFAYSLVPHRGDYRAANIERRGREANNPLITRMPEHSCEGKLGLVHSFMKLDATDNVIVTAIKKADRDDSIIVRLAETGGKEGKTSLSIEGAGKMASTVNFLERQDEPVSGDIAIGPFKIVTVRLSLPEQ